MIVREIAKHPELLEDFDWFNDYNDTRDWALHKAPDMVPLLDEGFKKWLEKIEAKLK